MGSILEKALEYDAGVCGTTDIATANKKDARRPSFREPAVRRKACGAWGWRGHRRGNGWCGIRIVLSVKKKSDSVYEIHGDSE